MDTPQFEATSSTDVAEPIPLVSAEGNHPPHDWGQATASMILDLRNLSGERLERGKWLQSKAASLLAGLYTYVIAKERENLATFIDHCDSDYDVLAQARKAVTEIR